MGIVDEVKSVAGLVNKLKDPELMQHVINLQNSVLELNNENAKLREKVTDLENIIKNLEKEKEVGESLNIEFGTYFSTRNSKKDGPFCTRCFDVDRNLVRLNVLTNGYAECPQCKNGFHYKCRV